MKRERRRLTRLDRGRTFHRCTRKNAAASSTPCSFPRYRDPQADCTRLPIRRSCCPPEAAPKPAVRRGKQLPAAPGTPSRLRFHWRNCRDSSAQRALSPRWFEHEDWKVARSPKRVEGLERVAAHHPQQIRLQDGNRIEPKLSTPEITRTGTHRSAR